MRASQPVHVPPHLCYNSLSKSDGETDSCSLYARGGSLRMSHRKRRSKRRPDDSLSRDAHPDEATPQPSASTDGMKDLPDQSLSFAGIQMSQHGRFLLQQNARSEEEQRQFLQLLAETRKSLPDTIRAQAQEIEALLGRHNYFDIISLIAFSQVWDNPETYKEWAHEGQAAYAEYAALLCLKKPFREEPVGELIDGRVLTDLIARIQSIFNHTLWYFGSKSAERGDSAGAVEDELWYVSITNSMMVRNQSYPHHLKELLTGLLHDSDPWLLQTLGFQVSDIFAIEEKVTRLGFDRLYERRDQSLVLEKQLMEALSQMRLGASPSEPEIEPLLSDILSLPSDEVTSQIRNIAIGLTFVSLGTTFSWTQDEVSVATGIPSERVGAFLRTFSIGFGEVDKDFYMPSPRHDLMTRPLIHHGGRYLLPVPDLLSAVQPRLEQLLNPDDPRAVNHDKKRWERYQLARADYTERETLSLFQQLLPRATIHPKVKYEVQEEEKDTQCELDGLIVFDTSALLIEVKAGSVHESARRGGPKRIAREVGRLLADPHAQAARAQRYIESCESPTFELATGDKFILDKSRLKRVFRITVTLDHMDALSAALHRTAELGLFPDNSLPWAVGIRDLMVVAEMFEFPSQFIHYLTRRKRLNEIGRIYAHDELDWLGHYLTEGLYFEEIASTENAILRLLSYTTQFDDYYFYQLGIRQTPAPKPGWKLPPTLHRIIQELEATAAPGYSEVVFRLLDISADSHDQFVGFFDRIRKETRKDGRLHNASMSFSTARTGMTMFSTKIGGYEAALESLKHWVDWKLQKEGAESWLGLLSVVGDRSLIHGWVLSPR